MRVLKIGFAVLVVSTAVMALSLAGGGSPNAGISGGDGLGRDDGRSCCPAQGGCGSEKGCDGCPASTACNSKGQCSSSTKSCGAEKGCDGCPVSTACSSKGQCSSQTKGCGSEGGACGGCSGEEGKCDTTKCLECPLAGDCDKIDLTNLGVSDTMVPPLPQSSDDDAQE